MKWLFIDTIDALKFFTTIETIYFTSYMFYAAIRSHRCELSLTRCKLPVLKCKHGIFGGLRWQFGLWERQWWRCCWKYFVGWKRRWHCDRLHENNIKNPAQFYVRGLFVRPLSDNEGCRAPFRQCQCISRAALTAPCQMQCSGSGHYSANLLAGVSRQGAGQHRHCWPISGVYTKFSGRLSEEPFPWLIQKFPCILIFKTGQPGCQLNLSEGQMRLDLTSGRPLV